MATDGQDGNEGQVERATALHVYGGSMSVAATRRAMACMCDPSTIELSGEGGVGDDGPVMFEVPRDAPVIAHGYTMIRAHTGAKVIAHDQAMVRAHQDAIVHAYDRATVVRWSPYAEVVLHGEEAVLVDRSADPPVCYVGETAHAAKAGRPAKRR